MQVATAKRKLDRWISIADAARLAEEPKWRMRRRLQDLNEATGGRILRRFGTKRGARVKIWVSTEELLRELGSTVHRHDGEISRIKADLEGLGRNLRRLRVQHQGLAEHVRLAEKRQDEINRANQAAIEAVRQLAHMVGT